MRWLHSGQMTSSETSSVNGIIYVEGTPVGRGIGYGSVPSFSALGINLLLLIGFLKSAHSFGVPG